MDPYFGWLWSVALDRPQIRCTHAGGSKTRPQPPGFTKISFFNSEPVHYGPTRRSEGSSINRQFPPIHSI